jgi:hypothetical protein
MMTAETVRELVAQLRAVLAEVDAGRVETTAVQRAYLAGSADTLGRLAGVPMSSIRDTSSNANPGDGSRRSCSPERPSEK